MLEIRIEVTPGETRTGRCVFCWRRLNDPQDVAAVVYEDGESWGGLACDDCLTLDDAALRQRLAETADNLADMVSELRDFARSVIRRPAPDVLRLERLYRASPSGPVVDVIVPSERGC